MIMRGDLVEILQAYQDPGDDSFAWQAVDDEEKGRITICPINHPMTIKPTYVVEAAWLRSVA